MRLIFVLLIATPAFGIHLENRRARVGLVEISTESPCLWMARQPLSLDVRNYAKLRQDGSVAAYVGVFVAPKAGLYIVDEMRNGELFPDVTRHLVEVEGEGPNPPDPLPPDPDPPGPDPDLSEYALAIYKKAKEVNQPEVAKKIGDVYGGVAASVAAGAIKTREGVRDSIESGMQAVAPLDRKWKPLGDLIIASFEKQATTVKKAQQLCEEVAKGMYEAAK